MPSPELLHIGSTAPLIRAAVQADVPTILEMVGELARHNGDEPRASLKGLEGDLFGPAPWACAFVAEQGRTLLGYTILYRLYRAHFGERGIELHHLFVTERARGMGLGRRLVEAAINEARLGGCAFLVLGTHPENFAAQRFYESLGLKRAAQERPRFQLMLCDR